MRALCILRVNPAWDDIELSVQILNILWRVVPECFNGIDEIHTVASLAGGTWHTVGDIVIRIPTFTEGETVSATIIVWEFFLKALRDSEFVSF